MSLLSFHGMMRSGQFAGTFEPLAARAPAPAEALAPIRERMRTDEVFRGRRADIAEELAKVGVGAGQEETLNSVFRVAFASLKQQGRVVGEFEDVMKLRSFDPTEIAFGYRHQTEMEAQRMLSEEATRLGIEPGVPEVLAHGMRTGAPEFMGRERLYGLSRQVLGAGGDIQPGFGQIGADVGAKLDAIQAELVKANEQREKQQTRGAPPIQARPAVQTR